jgi:hypothetical protein
VAAYVIVNTTKLSGRNYTTSRDATCNCFAVVATEPQSQGFTGATR